MNSSAIIKPEEFTATYKATPEDISTSPTSCHVRHYKAILQDDHLVHLHATMMSLPFQVGFAPDRWMHVTDIMLEKDTDNSCCHPLWIIALFESDFNQAKWVLFGRQLTQYFKDHQILTNMQHGSQPSWKCHKAVLTKVLSHDIVHITRKMAAFLKFNAIGCYDGLMNNLVLALLKKLVLPFTMADPDDHSDDM
jgi:hypothetical protein